MLQHDLSFTVGVDHYRWILRPGVALSKDSMALSVTKVFCRFKSLNLRRPTFEFCASAMA